jgi:hypothetical protein
MCCTHLQLHTAPHCLPLPANLESPQTNYRVALPAKTACCSAYAVGTPACSCSYSTLVQLTASGWRNANLAKQSTGRIGNDLLGNQQLPLSYRGNSSPTTGHAMLTVTNATTTVRTKLRTGRSCLTDHALHKICHKHRYLC